MITLDNLAKKIRQPGKGQSLVEMAVIMPILIFMMIGVLEVGWVLRSYLTLVNLNRELARFAIRPATLDFSSRDPDIIGYDKVMTHTGTVSGQLGVDFETNSTLIISHIVVDTGSPCTRDDLIDDDCDCEALGNGTFNDTFTYDDVILHPNMPGYEYFTTSFPTTTITGSANLTSVSRIDYITKTDELVRQNNRFNCEFAKKQVLTDTSKALETSPNNIIIVEVAFDQPQLLGFPIISNTFTDPVPLYAQTTMRLIAGARSAQGTQSIRLVGLTCDAHPWFVREGNLNTGITTTQSIFDGWVKWGQPNFSENDEQYIRSSLIYPQMAMNEYETGGELAPIAVGRNVNTLAKNFASTEVLSDFNGIVNNLRSQRVIIPVLGDGTTEIVHFVEVEIGSDTPDVDVVNGVIQGQYIRDVADGDFDDRCLPAVP